jgi:penicillin amidase
MTMKAHIQRDKNGVAHITAADLDGLYWGQGYAHAVDRGLQLLLMRILGQGRACELLSDNAEMLRSDRYFRRMNWRAGAAEQIAALDAEVSNWVHSYCDGVNAGFRLRIPWELKLLGIKPEPWTPSDTILLCRLLTFTSLSQSQMELERLVVEMVQAGVDLRKLAELFPGQLDALDVDLIGTIALGERIVSPHVHWQTAVPRLNASNNWAVAGSRSASGHALICNDPHLETNRLPNVWYEVVMSYPGGTVLGGSMPGAPGVLTGRSAQLAWTVTYAFMDTVDSWVERCRDGAYYREDRGWVDFAVRRERILRQNHANETVTFYENGHGVLDGDPSIEGHYLATRWSADRSGAATLDALLRLPQETAAAAAMDIVGRVETDWSFVLADRRGNIGFQMSGLCPKRPPGASGLVPLAGWRPENDWRGFEDHRNLPRCLNPEAGYFVTANQDLNTWGKIAPINACMGTYRADRIAHLLETGGMLDVAKMQVLQQDLYSPQAEAFMAILRPLLPDSPQGRILAEWDLRYTADSKGATLFERVYTRLMRDVFGRHGMGFPVTNYLFAETGIFIDFYANFDRILLSRHSAWFDDRPREDLFREAVDAALKAAPESWGKSRQIMFKHLLLGGRLPRFLGFDRGPAPAAGGRATVHQGQVYRSGGRETTFMPSLRLIIDMNEAGCHTNLAGGPSERRFSKWYVSDLDNWLAGRYKQLQPGAGLLRFP